MNLTPPPTPTQKAPNIKIETPEDPTNKEQITPNGTYRIRIEEVIGHTHRKKGILFRCKWEGFNAITDEPLEVATKAIGPMKTYLKSISKRSKTILLRRYECLGQFYKK